MRPPNWLVVRLSGKMRDPLHCCEKDEVSWSLGLAEGWLYYYHVLRSRYYSQGSVHLNHNYQTLSPGPRLLLLYFSVTARPRVLLFIKLELQIKSE